MTDPSQYFRGRTVQEQMNEVIGYVDVRSAEVATDAIAADVAQVHQDMLDADADATAAAASAAAAAGTLANAVKKTGEASQSIAGDIAVAGDLTGGTVTVPTPTNNTDAANKKYVDDQDALDVHLAGNQTVADVKTFSSSPVVPTEATGTFSTKAANSDKVKNELDAYTPMVRTTGNQNIAGTKKFTNHPFIEMTQYPEIEMNETNVSFDGAGISAMGLLFNRNGSYSGRLVQTTENDGSVTIDLMIKSNDTLTNKEGRLQIYEKTDHTFGMRFWNGNAWTNLVS